MGSRVVEARRHVLELVRAGLPPGSPVSVKDTTDRLRISHTPVREALERLVGEGVLVSGPDRNGFAVPRLSVRDVANLHHLYGVLLRGLAEGAPASLAASGWTPDPRDAGGAMDDLLDRAGASGLPPMVVAALRATDLRLAPYRVVEPSIIPDWSNGLLELCRGIAGGRRAAHAGIMAFTRIRIARAGAIVAAVEDLHSPHVPDMYRI